MNSERRQWAHWMLPLAGHVALACGADEPMNVAFGDPGVKPDAGSGSADEPSVDEMQPVALSIRGIWGAARDDVWGVGAAGVIIHFDGNTWSKVESPTDRDLQDVHGASSDDAWAVGDDIILRWDGEQWFEVLRDMDELLLGAWSEGPNDLWTSGTATDVNLGVLRHWNGSDWEVGTTPQAKSLWDVWASPEGNVWAGGSTHDGGGFVVQGTSPAFEPLEYEGGSPRAIWGRGSSDLWIAPYEGAMQHWDGAEWTADLPRDDVRLIDMAGSPEGDAWAVGLKGFLLRWDGQSWSQMVLDTEANLSSIWAAASDDAWISGSKGTLLHWDGTTWEPQYADATVAR